MQNGSLDFWANGENVCISEPFAAQLKRIADGENVVLDESFNDDAVQERCHAAQHCCCNVITTRRIKNLLRLLISIFQVKLLHYINSIIRY